MRICHLALEHLPGTQECLGSTEKSAWAQQKSFHPPGTNTNKEQLGNSIPYGYIPQTQKVHKSLWIWAIGLA